MRRRQKRRPSQPCLTAAIGNHAYYSLDRPAAYLADRLEASLTGETLFRAQVRFDKVLLYPGIGDPTHSYGTGAFPLRFTKRLGGRVEGLVFLRDLAPAGTLSTRMQARQGGQVKDTQSTSAARRYYRSSVLKAGAYEMVRVDENNSAGLPQSVSVVNRKVGEKGRWKVRGYFRLCIVRALLADVRLAQSLIGGSARSA